MAGQDESKQKKKGKGLPEHIELQRTHMVCGAEMNSYTNTFTSANVFMPMGVDNAWDLGQWKEGFRIKVNKLTSEMMEVDITGVDPAVVNALRRILIAEVPTMAIEHVFVANNTSIIQDEVLAHRLGMVPLLVDPAMFEYKTAEEAASEKNMLVFKLDITCKKQGDRLLNDKVFSSSLQWLPMGSEMPDETGCRFAQGQAHRFPPGGAVPQPSPVHDNILLAKLRAGQVRVQAGPGPGPGTPASRSVSVQEPNSEAAALLLAAAPGLITQDASGKIEVGNAREHEQHLEKVRVLLDTPCVAECIQLRKRKDYFIFTIESSGVLPPEVLLEQAIAILHDKASRLAQRL
ncbi:hypothetical protein QJQ45_027478 [Haematococcus lacustris]|nr:hypothetical protein QJQ45_027478 [Haematococcus lacustris]